jgi:hypothetical protein
VCGPKFIDASEIKGRTDKRSLPKCDPSDKLGQV